jgi:hypothetical protein
MRIRTAAVAGLVVAAGLAGPAAAAPKKLCNLVVDGTGDTFALRYQDTYHSLGVPYGPQEDKLDLTGADLGSSTKFFTAVIRVKNVSATVGTAPGGVEYDVNFTNPSYAGTLYLRAIYPSSGSPVYEFGYRTGAVATTLPTKLADATGFVDPKRNEIHITVPAGAFANAGGLKPNAKIAFGEVTAGRYAGGRAVFADVVVGDKVYPTHAASCVTPGK